MKSSLVAVALLPVFAAAFAQQPASTQSPSTKPVIPANYQGCVSKLTYIDRYVLSAGDRCMLLSGSIDAAKLKDHNVLLHGLLLEAAGHDPLTLKVDKPAQIKDVCSVTCELEAPGGRGPHGKEKPGSEGGPRGVAPTPPPQP